MVSFSAPTSNPNPFSLPFPKSMLINPTPNRLIFNPTHPKPASSVRTLSGYYFRSRAKTAINSSSSCKNHLHLTEEAAAESLYCLLGVSEAATLPEIKKAYRKLALKYHPDVSPPDFSQAFTGMFIRIQEAYETLSDPITRALYDFSDQKLYQSHQPGMDMSGDWKWRWQAQLEELERKSSNKDSKDRKSWAARIRRESTI